MACRVTFAVTGTVVGGLGTRVPTMQLGMGDGLVV